MSPQPAGPGLPRERTLLAWRRTCLACGVAGLLIVRFGVPRLGTAAVVGGLGALVLAGAAFLDAARRYRRDTSPSTGAVPPSSAVPVTLAAGAVALAGLCCLCWVVARP